MYFSFCAGVSDRGYAILICPDSSFTSSYDDRLTLSPVGMVYCFLLSIVPQCPVCMLVFSNIRTTMAGDVDAPASGEERRYCGDSNGGVSALL